MYTFNSFQNIPRLKILAKKLNFNLVLTLYPHTSITLSFFNGSRNITWQLSLVKIKCHKLNIVLETNCGHLPALHQANYSVSSCHNLANQYYTITVFSWGKCVDWFLKKKLYSLNLKGEVNIIFFQKLINPHIYRIKRQ